MCSGKGAGSPQGYNTGVVPPQGMSQFTNIQNQYKPSPWDAAMQKPPTLMGSQPGLATTQPVMGPFPTSGGMGGAPAGGGSLGGYDLGGPGMSYGTGGGSPYPPMPANGYPGGQAAWEASQDIIRSGNEAPPGFMFQPATMQPGLATTQAGRPTLDNPDPGLGAGYVRPEMGLLGGGPVGGATRTGGMTPMQTGSSGTINNYNMTPELQAQLDKARSMFPAGAGPRPGGPETGPNHTGLPGGVGGGWANNQYNPANRDPNAGRDRMAASAAYQQSLTPEMLQAQINNGQRAPTSNVQLQAMLANMDPQARADYIAQYKAKTGLDVTAGPSGSGVWGQ